jgi:hypothetical protein
MEILEIANLKKVLEVAKIEAGICPSDRDCDRLGYKFQY